jgi:hypothetical protein
MSQFPLRVPDHVMEEAREAAQEERVSINQLLLALIADGLGQRCGLRMMRERAARANPGAARAVLDKVPDLPPEPGDEMPDDDDVISADQGSDRNKA